jgi:hypothetical protein
MEQTSRWRCRSHFHESISQALIHRTIISPIVCMIESIIDRSCYDHVYIVRDQLVDTLVIECSPGNCGTAQEHAYFGVMSL